MRGCGCADLAAVASVPHPLLTSRDDRDVCSDILENQRRGHTSFLFFFFLNFFFRARCLFHRLVVGLAIRLQRLGLYGFGSLGLGL